MQRAAQIVTEEMQIPQVLINEAEGKLNIAAEISRSAEINTKLVKAGLEVLELGVLSTSYEDYFLQKMGPVNV